MDGFDKKREVIEMLMDMLRKSATDEVSPDAKAVSMEKVSMTPNMASELHPEAETHGDAVSEPMPEEMADDMKEMPMDDAEGGTPFEALLNKKRGLK